MYFAVMVQLLSKAHNSVLYVIQSALLQESQERKLLIVTGWRDFRFGYLFQILIELVVM